MALDKKRAISLLLLVASAASCSTKVEKPGTAPEVDETPRTSEPTAADVSTEKMRAFESKEELEAFLKKHARKRGRANAKLESASDSDSPAPMASSAPEAEGITNNQVAGVDEGGIVKVHGDHLVVLRRGRLFTVRVDQGALDPVSTVDAFGTNVSPTGAWYDEMLVSGDTIVVIGYSYQRGGTELGIFDIDRAGRLTYRATHHLKSNDYYSSRNYASRLIGNKLVFYSPMYLGSEGEALSRTLPAVRRWHDGATEAEWKTIIEPSQIWRPELPDDEKNLALHTVTECDLSKTDLACTARGVLGPAGRVFYVSQSSVYVWMTSWKSSARGQSAPESYVYRLPLTGGSPTALATRGAPIDQFSFMEDRDHLNVVVRAEGTGEAMWSSETTAGDVALLRVPLAQFSRNMPPVERSSYRRLPRPKGYVFQNRFVGEHLLYGTGMGYGNATRDDRVFVTKTSDVSGKTSELVTGHGVDRIEAMGKDAVVVGGDGKSLHFSSVSLGKTPALGGRYSREGASQGELRSHGFFYKPEDTQHGVFGLPIRTAGQPGSAHLTEGSASIMFVRNDALKFFEMGELESGSTNNVNDDCKASCVDWYGNARPIFFQGRVFALLGYELVEGSMSAEKIREVKRVSFAPGATRRVTSAPSPF